jgi:hypothetical protein
VNSREQYLQKQNERLRAQLSTTLVAFGHAVDENEFLASVACGFAWDLMINLQELGDDNRDPYCNAIDDVRFAVEDEWLVAVQTMEKLNAEAKK